MIASDPSPNHGPDSDTLGDRVVDRWIGVDEIKLPPTSNRRADTGRGQWNQAQHRFRTAWPRFRRWLASVVAGGQSLYDEPASAWKERLIDVFAYALMAAILAAFAYVVYRGLQLAGW